MPTRPDLCPNCGASTTAHTGTYCHECGERLVPEAPWRQLIDDLVAERVPEPNRKPWSEVTDDEFMEAVRLAYVTRTTAPGGFRKDWLVSGDVHTALVNPRDPSHRSMPRGLGLIPPYGEGQPPQGAITRRLNKLVAEGKLTAVELVSPRAGRPAGHGYIIREEQRGYYGERGVRLGDSDATH